jgi:hypothetical protein
MFRFGLLLNLWHPVKFTPFSVDAVVRGMRLGFNLSISDGATDALDDK